MIVTIVVCSVSLRTCRKRVWNLNFWVVGKKGFFFIMFH